MSKIAVKAFIRLRKPVIERYSRAAELESSMGYDTGNPDLWDAYEEECFEICRRVAPRFGLTPEGLYYAEQCYSMWDAQYFFNKYVTGKISHGTGRVLK